MPFLNIADLDLEISEIIAEAEAILALAEKEDRELKPDEVARLDEIQGSDGKGGKLAALKSDKQRKENVKALQRQKLDARIHGDGPPPPDGSTAPAPRGEVKIPARARAAHALEAYETEEDAYVAGQVILAEVFGNAAAADWCKKHPEVLGSQVESDNTKGGFFVPEEMQRAIQRLREQHGVFQRYARNYPMGGDTMVIPRDLQDVDVYWVAEGAEITETEKTVAGAQLDARKIAALAKISSELDEDSVVDIGDMITRSIAYKMAYKIDDAGFNGDGTSGYGGHTGLKNALHANATHDAASGNTGAKTLDIDDFEDTIGKYPQFDGATPVWFMHSAIFWAACARLQLAAGGNTRQDLGAGPVFQMLGYPVVFTQVLPSTTTASASTILAYFGDLRLAATLGNRRGARTAISTERYFETDMIGLRVTERVGITVHERGSELNERPILALKTAAS